MKQNAWNLNPEGREPRVSGRGSLGQDGPLFHFERWERVHVDGGQANQTGVALITAAVQHANHSPHAVKVYKVLNSEDLVGEKKKVPH